MRTLVHLSDLHFGRIDPATTDPLVERIEAAEPDVVVVSGDLTQRARRGQFRAARNFLDRLPGPRIVVPGNHDVPLYNLVARFLFPLSSYRRFIDDDPAPFHRDEEIAIAGVNTARSLTWKGGRINADQVAALRERLCGLEEGVVAVVVAHHPFDLPPGHGRRDLVGRARMAMEALAECGVDLFLTGHLHRHHVGHTAERYRIRDHAAVVVQAGTATSTRGRGERNSFNVVRISRDEIEVEPWLWRPDGGRFDVDAARPPIRFEREGGVWSPA
ncbi:MAG: metallophosphoesterase family protein [Gemmatimonadota bacterium]|nr:metallophosphoesterase family protein [Gemmatimonadota bacterium]